MWHYDLMRRWKMRYMMKQVFLVFFLLFGFVAGAQNVTVRKPKKQKPATTYVAPKKERASKQRKVQSKKAKVDISPTIGKANYTPNVKTFYANGVSFEMVEVRGGTFRMGATSEQGSDVWEFEKPVHSVTLSGYYIGKTEVTQALWKAVMGSNPSKFKGDNLPVENVSWYDCQEFIRKLNSLADQNFRLPTEAEWEFACRGGNNSRGYKYSGSNYIDNVAWYGGNSGRETHPVATKSPNELGIYDMAGNVWEWCADWEGDYSSGAQTNPKGPYDGSHRVERGGCWNYDASDCRSSDRGGIIPGDRLSYLGLRLSL